MFQSGQKEHRMSQALATTRIEAGPQRLDLGAFAPLNRKRLSGPGLRTFLAIADLWGLGEEQRRIILGYPSRSTYHNWTRAVREHRDISLDLDVLTRISAILGIHQALQVLYATEAEGVAWLRGAQNATVFGGQPPLEMLTGGSQDGLLTVRRFLDAARGGLSMAPNAVDRDALPCTDEDIVFS
jgi:Protein of unknown function (DUF2384)